MSSWDTLFVKKEHRWKLPSDCVVEIVELLKRNNAYKILDLGCGAGRHTVFLAKRGFFVVGSDVSAVGLREAKKWLKSEGLRIVLILKGDVTRLPHPSEYFDAVISINVIHHNTLKNIEKTVKEIERVLRKDGFVLVTVASENNAKYGKGQEIEEGTFITDEGEEKGIIHHFFNKEAIEELFSNFEIIEIKEIREVTPDNLTCSVPNHWKILARLSK